MFNLKKWINIGRLKSPWVVHFDCGSCNGCDIEILAALTPVHDLERFGILNIGNPKHADVLVVSGTVNHRNKHALKNIYDQMSQPKAVIAVGSCGLTGGVFHDAYNVVGGVDKVIPVDVYVPGCPPKPEQLIDAVIMALGKVKEKLEAADAEQAAAEAEQATADAAQAPPAPADAAQVPPAQADAGQTQPPQAGAS